VFEAFEVFKVFVELQYDVSMECLHNDKGGKYISHIWDAYFAETGICCKHTVEQGGVAEHHNHMLEEHVVAMLNSTCLPT
jgi:hypothetical protein